MLCKTKCCWWSDLNSRIDSKSSRGHPKSMNIYQQMLQIWLKMLLEKGLWGLSGRLGSLFGTFWARRRFPHRFLEDSWWIWLPIWRSKAIKNPSNSWVCFDIAFKMHFSLKVNVCCLDLEGLHDFGETAILLKWAFRLHETLIFKLSSLQSLSKNKSNI